MPRPKGSPNKSPRELMAGSNSLKESARLKARIIRLEKKVTKLQKKK
jgi:hypothetical protein